MILDFCNSVSTQSENTFEGITPFIPLIGITGTISFFIYHNRPQIIEKKEIANYINYETNIRIHEYSFKISGGSDKINWNYVPILRKIKSINVGIDTKTEFYYLTRSTGEEFVPNECIEIKNDQKKKKIHFKNIKKIKDEDIETIYLITKDIEKSSYSPLIKEKVFPNDISPEKMEIINENRVTIQNYEIIFTKHQTEDLIRRHVNYSKYIRWNNASISDCLVEAGELKIILKDIPKKTAGLPGTVIIDLL